MCQHFCIFWVLIRTYKYPHGRVEHLHTDYTMSVRTSLSACLPFILYKKILRENNASSECISLKKKERKNGRKNGRKNSQNKERKREKKKERTKERTKGRKQKGEEKRLRERNSE